MTKGSLSGWWRQLLIRFVLLFASIFGLISTILYSSYLKHVSRDLETTKLEASYNAQLLHNEIGVKLSLVISDLRLISQLPALMNYISIGSQNYLNDLNSAFLLFSRYRSTYYQVIYLDNQGMEIARIDFNDGKPMPVSKDQLLPMGPMDFFTKTITLNRNQIYISSLSLFAEGGSVIEPYQPVLVMATPVFDHFGRKQGIVVLDYIGDRLLNSLDNLKAQSGDTLLVNSDGYYLHNQSDPDTTWGFVIADRSNDRFDLDLPKEWEKIVGADSGQIQTNNGLFTFITISPTEPAFYQNLVVAPFSVKEQPTWKLVLFFPQQHIFELTEKTREIYINQGIIFFFLSLLFAGVIAWGTIEVQMDRELLKFNALHDSLTGLPNRNLFMDRLRQTALLSRREESHFAVFFIDLDGFKPVNDRFGHRAGDLLLKHVTGNLAAVLRESDTLSRMGGDEFCVLLPGIDNREDASQLAERMLAAISIPLKLKDVQVVVTGSIGVSLQSSHPDPADLILTRADHAMYQAKQMGRNRVSFDTETQPDITI